MLCVCNMQADADWHRPGGWDEAATPNMMKELKAGIELDNMYAFKVGHDSVL